MNDLIVEIFNANEEFYRTLASKYRDGKVPPLKLKLNVSRISFQGATESFPLRNRLTLEGTVCDAEFMGRKKIKITNKGK